MAQRKCTPHGGGKKGDDGLTDRERAFVAARRADPGAANHEIAGRAGFIGSPQKLAERARLLMKKPAVMIAICAPDPAFEREVDDEEGLKREMRKLFLRITRKDGASDADKIKAADKLLATIVGGFVPVQVDQKNVITLESWVRAMGGAPEDQDRQPSLPEPKVAGEERA